MLRYDEESIAVRLEGLTTALRAAFAALCSERLMPRYVTYADETGRARSSDMLGMATRVWEIIERGVVDLEEIKTLAEACESLVPDSDSHNLPYHMDEAYAEEAAAALTYALWALRSGRSQDAAYAARCARGALEYYVTNVERTELADEHALDGHPAVQTELRRQQRDIDDLLKLAEGVEGAPKLADLRERARREAREFFPSPGHPYR